MMGASNEKKYTNRLWCAMKNRKEIKYMEIMRKQIQPTSMDQQDQLSTIHLAEDNQ